MNTSNLIIKWSVIGALLGFLILHPFIHIISILHSPNWSLVPENLASEILKSFSVSMLPWGLAFMVLSGLVGLFWGRVKQADEEKSGLIAQLRKALEEVKTLSGFLPICASCKKIRDDKGYWNQIEAYISEHSEAEFSHGICPDCLEKLYPEM